MRFTTLFGLYVTVIFGLVGGLGALTLYNLEKSQWWDARTQLAQESYGLHLTLEANIFRLMKQHGDALLIGDRDGGAAEATLKADIAETISRIRTVIAHEIQMVGEEEIEELALLDAIEDDIRAINAAIASLTATGVPIAADVQLERLATLLDDQIDRKLDAKIATALAEELEEVEEVLADAAAFRAANRRLVYAILAATTAMLILGLVSFNAQIKQPILRLRDSIERLRDADYATPVTLGGSREFRDLGAILGRMSAGLAAHEANRDRQARHLEETVATRTAELQRLIDKLETGEESRKRLMADISHELRTPLAIILGEAEVTLRTAGRLDEDVSDAFARIRDSARHTNQIVDDLLTVARQEAGQLRLDRRETDLRKVVRDAVAMFPGAVAVESPDSPVPALVDEVRLRQSVLALLQNARRYGGPGITARLRDETHAVVICVEDDGPGMSAAEKSQAFDRFFRGTNAADMALEGNGLGLPIVKSIVEAHGGTVELQDRDSGGLRVVVTLQREARAKLVSSGPARKSA